MAIKRDRLKAVIVFSIILSLSSQSSSFAASKVSINNYYKKIYRQMASTGNNDALSALTYYDVEIKQAIGKILDGKIKCDTKSKKRYKTIAYDTSNSEVDQLIFGFYLGYCNSK
jgi:hypothetical protein